jgi:hypothetical protein
MNMMKNLETLTQTNYNSGSLGGLATVVHRVAEAGQYPLTILQNDKAVQTMVLMVQGSIAGAPAPTAPTELHIDLSGIVNTPGQLSTKLSELVVASSGYAVFYAPAGTSGFAVQLYAPGAADKKPVFDSHQLGNGDIFATTMFRPGRYSVTNKVNNAQAKLRVSYPVISNTPYSPPEAFTVQLDQNGFQPNDIQLMPAQGIVFHIGNTEARIAIDLVEPDDGPHLAKAQAQIIAPPATGRILPDFRWVKPETPER